MIPQQTIDGLIESAQQHQQPLRMTVEFYEQVSQYLHDLYQATPGLPELVVISDGTENIKLVDGDWTFVPSG